MVFVWVAVFGGVSHRWATRVGKTEDFGDLIEAFADGVVSGGADNFEVIMALHVDDLSVATADDGGEKWEFWLVAAEPVGIDVRFKVMSWVERFVVDDGEGAGGKSAGEQGADEARGMSDGDGVDIVNGEVGVFESLV